LLLNNHKKFTEVIVYKMTSVKEIFFFLMASFVMVWATDVPYCIITGLACPAEHQDSDIDYTMLGDPNQKWQFRGSTLDGKNWYENLDAPYYVRYLMYSERSGGWMATASPPDVTAEDPWTTSNIQVRLEGHRSTNARQGNNPAGFYPITHLYCGHDTGDAADGCSKIPRGTTPETYFFWCTITDPIPVPEVICYPIEPTITPSAEPTLDCTYYDPILCPDAFQPCDDDQDFRPNHIALYDHTNTLMTCADIASEITIDWARYGWSYQCAVDSEGRNTFAMYFHRSIADKGCCHPKGKPRCEELTNDQGWDVLKKYFPQERMVHGIYVLGTGSVTDGDMNKIARAMTYLLEDGQGYANTEAIAMSHKMKLVQLVLTNESEHKLMQDSFDEFVQTRQTGAEYSSFDEFIRAAQTADITINPHELYTSEPSEVQLHNALQTIFILYASTYEFLFGWEGPSVVMEAMKEASAPTAWFKPNYTDCDERCLLAEYFANVMMARMDAFGAWMPSHWNRTRLIEESGSDQDKAANVVLDVPYLSLSKMAPSFSDKLATVDYVQISRISLISKDEDEDEKKED